MSVPPPRGAITTAEVAIALGVTTDRVRQLRADGVLTPRWGTARKPLYHIGDVAYYKQVRDGKRGLPVGA